MGRYQYSKAVNPYAGLAVSTVTGNVHFSGDCAAVNFSWSTDSTTASRLTVQGHDWDGFFSSLDANGWTTTKAVTAQGLHSLDTVPRWIRFQCNPSTSTMTVRLALFVA